jgi:hypothetical protein
MICVHADFNRLSIDRRCLLQMIDLEDRPISARFTPNQPTQNFELQLGSVANSVELKAIAT